MKKNINMFEDKILSTLIKLSVPIMGTAFIAIAYSLVDIIWIGRLSTASVAATGTSGVLIWFAQSLMLIPKVGMSVRLHKTTVREIMKSQKFQYLQDFILQFL